MERLDNDEEIVDLLLKNFAKNIHLNFTELQQAREDKNAEMVHLSGHTIKGSPPDDNQISEKNT